MAEHPWTPDPEGRVWTTVGHGFNAKSTRNDQLWEQLTQHRESLMPIAHAWRDAAGADGWSIEPTYQHEPADQAWTLRRDGFTVQGLTRPGSTSELPTIGLHVWGPDRLAVTPPPTYDWSALVAGTRTCSACHAVDVDTQRVGFAGRVCADCLPEQRRRIETPGWCS